MNSRITLVSDREVRIALGPIPCTTFVTLECDKSLVFIRNPPGCTVTGWEDQSYAALIDCLHCLRDTGSFSALADTSAVPFVGKQFKHADSLKVLTLGFRQEDYGGGPVWRATDGGVVAGYKILPLTPAPKVRPFDFTEACGFFSKGEFDLEKNGECRHVCAVGQHCFFTTDATWIRFEEAVKWNVNGTPCGFVGAP